MTGAVFDLWLSEWHRELYKQKRRIALLVNNAPGHIADDYDNIELVFPPPNTTSKLTGHHSAFLVSPIQIVSYLLFYYLLLN